MTSKVFSENTPNVIYPIDLTQMKEKVYDNVMQFEADIKWFAHNCRVVFPSVQVQKASEELIKYVNDDFQYIQNCGDCYNNAYEYKEKSSVLFCKKSHVLVWAKSLGYDYWPAKAFSSNNGKTYVRFFGEDTSAEVATEQLYLYSKDYPGNLSSVKSDLFDLALKVRFRFSAN